METLKAENMTHQTDERCASFTLSQTGQSITLVARHVTDITAAVQDIPRCRVRLTNGDEVILDHAAQDVIKALFDLTVSREINKL